MAGLIPSYVRRPPQKRMGIKQLCGYGVGDFGLNIYWNIISLFLIYWYTVIVGLPPQVAGLLYFIGMVWDAVSDPIVAAIAERVRTRHGTYRPFLFYGCWALLLMSVLLFWVPPLEGAALIAVLLAIILMFRTAYTFVAVPYAAMSARLTYDSVVRTELSGARMFFAYMGLLVVSYGFSPVARHISDNPRVSEYTSSGFQLATTVAALIATLALLICFAFTRELPPLEAPNTNRRLSSALKDACVTLRANRMLRLLLGAVFLQSAATTCLIGSLVFYIDANASMFAPKEQVLGAFALVMFLSVPLWTSVTRWLGRKSVWTIATIVFAFLSLNLLVTGQIVAAGLPLQIIAMGFAFGAFGILIWAFVPDSVEYGQLITGRRAEATSFGAMLVVQKLSGGLAGLGLGILLNRLGLTASNVSGVAEGLETFLAIVPATLLFCSLPLILYLPHDRKIHAGVVDLLKSQAIAPPLPGHSEETPE